MIEITERVEPQDGHGIFVKRFTMQTSKVFLEFCIVIPKYNQIYPTIQAITMNR